MNKLVQYDGEQLVVANEVLNKIETLNRVKKELEEYEKTFKTQLKDAMEQYGVKSIKNDVFTASYIDENTRTVLDTKKAKDFIQASGHKVSEFEKEQHVSSSVRIKYK